MERRTLEENRENKRDYAVLVGLRSPVLREDNADEESLAELAALVETAGGQAVGTILQSREKPDPHSFIGEGKVEEVRRMVQEEEATMVIFDNDLSPSQIRVLTEMTGVQVLDRSGLILDIFAQRAKTKEGCLQVELAQYQYLLPRLVGMWTHLERQAGTSGKGPIGSKGPGETQLETDRRHIHRKIDKLKAELEEVRRVRSTQRQRRQKNEIPVVAIVGYTNAGKSTLLKIIMKQIPADSGEVILAKDRTIGYLAQHEAVSSGNSIYEELLEVKQDIFELERHIRTLELQMKSQSGGELEQTLELYNRLNTEFEQKNGYACKSEIVGVLKGLGFTEDEFSKQVDTLSGGQKTRVALGKLLLAKPDLILLDEPTNHLDMQSIAWLENFLINYSGAVIIVAHDRYF